MPSYQYAMTHVRGYPDLILCRFLLPSTHKSPLLQGIIVCPTLGEGIPFQVANYTFPTLHEKFLSGSDCPTSCFSVARS